MRIDSNVISQETSMCSIRLGSGETFLFQCVLFFASIALYPLASENVLMQLKKKALSALSSDTEAKRPTPGAVRSLRRTIKVTRSETNDITAERPKRLDLKQTI